MRYLRYSVGRIQPARNHTESNNTRRIYIPPRGVHFDAQAMKRLRQIGQKAYEKKMAQNGLNEAEARQAFIDRYGKNYL